MQTVQRLGRRRANWLVILIIMRRAGRIRWSVLFDTIALTLP